MADAMRIEPDVSGVEVFLVGVFNPAIFTPAWFAMHELLPKAAADSAELSVAHPRLTRFSLDWLNLQVKTDRFTADTRQAPHVRVQDLVVRVFREHLHHTPLRALGINRYVHFRVDSSAERDRIRTALAPTEPWGHWREELALDQEHGGMTSLTMSQTRPAGRPSGGRINVTVEPSNPVGDGRTGVFVRVNDHYAAADGPPGGNAELTACLHDRFEASIRRSDGIIDHIMSLSKGTENS